MPSGPIARRLPSHIVPGSMSLTGRRGIHARIADARRTLRRPVETGQSFITAQWGFLNVFFLARLGQGSYTFSHAWRPQGGVRSSMGAIKVWPFLSHAVLLFGTCLEPGSNSSFQGSPKRNARFPFVSNRLLLFRTCFEPPRRHVLRGCPTHFCDFEPPSRLAL